MPSAAERTRIDDMRYLALTLFLCACQPPGPPRPNVDVECAKAVCPEPLKPRVIGAGYKGLYGVCMCIPIVQGSEHEGAR